MSTSPSSKKDSPRFFFRKKSDSPHDSPGRVARKRYDPNVNERKGAAATGGGGSPRIDFGPVVKLSEVSNSNNNNNNTIAMVNFRARKKTISEYLAPLTGLFASRRVSTLERLSYRSPPTKLAAGDDERRRVRGKPISSFVVL